jgi:hypothetical protein
LQNRFFGGGEQLPALDKQQKDARRNHTVPDALKLTRKPGKTHLENYNAVARIVPKPW